MANGNNPGKLRQALMHAGSAKTPTVRQNYKGRKQLDYADVGETVSDMVRLVTSQGGAVMFGLTSDGGAYSVCVLNNADKVKEYPTSPEELQDLYMWFRDVYYSA